MRIVINGLAALKPKTGVGHHVANLARALVKAFPDDEFWVYPGERLAGLARRFNRSTIGSDNSRGSAAGFRQLIGRAAGLVRKGTKAGCRYHFAAVVPSSRFQLYHEPNFVPFPSRIPTVITVHDLSVLRFPDWHPADRVRFHRERFAERLRHAAHVITVSESVRAEVVAELGLPAHCVTAIHNGISPAFRPIGPSDRESTLARLGLPARYLLCVGTIEPRKNVGTVMRAFADLPPPVRAGCPLVLVGPWGWKSEADRSYFESIGRDRGVRHLGYLADDDLPAVYSGAAGLVYPSYYEGFGLPPVEMLACGGRVVASTVPAVREVCGSVCELVSPDDLSGWQAAMLRLATDPGYQSDRRDAGVRHAGRYTWEQAARQTMAVYRQVVGLEPARAVATEAVVSPRPAA